MKLAYLSFTDCGEALARRLSETLGGTVSRCGTCSSLQEWTQEQFACADGLVFIGAAGIAVRAIAPHLVSKTTDPAVVAIDDSGRFAIPLVSGHLGGANDLARRISNACGAVAVVTTATDVHGVFAVDEWAKRQNCAVCNPEKIKLVSSALLHGSRIPIHSAWPIAGSPPDGICLAEEPFPCKVSLDLCGHSDQMLRLAPRIVVLGIGCKKGTAWQDIETVFQTLLSRLDLREQSICAVASIDIKKEEAGLLEFCRRHNWKLTTFSAQELSQAAGEFHSSAFVHRVTGVDNVCERSAVLASGGTLLLEKQASHGITMAFAKKHYTPDWRWQDE